MIDQPIVQKLRERYSDVPPLVFHRSLSYAKNASELFDILETMPKVFPLVWDSGRRIWVTVPDLCKMTKK